MSHTIPAVVKGKVAAGGKCDKKALAVPISFEVSAFSIRGPLSSEAVRNVVMNAVNFRQFGADQAAKVSLQQVQGRLTEFPRREAHARTGKQVKYGAFAPSKVDQLAVGQIFLVHRMQAVYAW